MATLNLVVCSYNKFEIPVDAAQSVIGDIQMLEASTYFRIGASPLCETSLRCDHPRPYECSEEVERIREIVSGGGKADAEM